MLQPAESTLRRSRSLGRKGEGESENNGKEKTASAERIHSRGRKCVQLPNLAGSMFGCRRSTLFVLFPWHWTKECIVGKPIVTYDTVQRKITAWGSIKGLTWPWCTRAQHGVSGWVVLPTEARVQFAQFFWELPVKPQAPVNWAKEESKDPAPRQETHKGRHFKRSLVKRRKNYTQILEENWNGFLKKSLTVRMGAKGTGRK